MKSFRKGSSDEIGHYLWAEHKSAKHKYWHERYFEFKPANGFHDNQDLGNNSDVVISGYDLINLGEDKRYDVKYGMAPRIVYNIGYVFEGATYITKIDFNYQKNNQFATKNFLNSQTTNITGYNQTFDKFIGGDGLYQSSSLHILLIPLEFRSISI